MSVHAPTADDRLARLNGLVLKLVLCLSITTLFQPYGAFNLINRAVVFLIVVLILITYTTTRYSGAFWVALAVLLLLVTYDLLISNGDYAKMNDVVYLPFWVVVVMAFKQSMKQMDLILGNSIGFIKGVAFCWCLLVGVSIFLPSSYIAFWGGSTYFVSIPGSIWRLAPSACIVQVALLIALAYDRKHKLIYMAGNLIPLYCGFMGGSRTYFAIIFLIFVIFLYFFVNSRRTFWLSLLITVVIGTVAIGSTGIGEKIAATRYTGTSGFDLLGTVSNGRTDIWASDVDYYSNAGSTAQLFGSGYDMIYSINADSKLGAAVYAHNDFLNILVSNGMVGLVLYLAPLAALFRSFVHEYHGRQAGPTFIIVLVLLIWLVNATFNMVYTYVDAVAALVLLPSAIIACEDDRKSVSIGDNTLSQAQDGSATIVSSQGHIATIPTGDVPAARAIAGCDADADR